MRKLGKKSDVVRDSFEAYCTCGYCECSGSKCYTNCAGGTTEVIAQVLNGMQNNTSTGDYSYISNLPQQ